MMRDEIKIKLDVVRFVLDEIEAMLDDVPIPVQPPLGPTGVLGNPYANTDDMVSVINDEWLEAGPKITDNIASSRYLRKLWEVAKRAGVKFIVLRGAHPDGCFDIEYPKINGELDRVAMGRIIDAFLAICVPPLPDWADTNPAEIRMGGDVWPITDNKHLPIDNDFHHRFDDTVYPHFHINVRIES